MIGQLRKLKLTTIPEFFEIRFNRRVRVLAGIICVLAGVLNMGLFPKMGATFITYATGLGESTDNSESVVNIITSLLIVMVLAYTVLGGMVAVLVTDYIQFVILSLGLGLGLWMCFTLPELGWEKIVSPGVTKKESPRSTRYTPNRSVGTYVIWMICLTFAASLCWAPEVTRALTTQDEKTTRRTFFSAHPDSSLGSRSPHCGASRRLRLFARNPELSHYFGLDGTENPRGIVPSDAAFDREDRPDRFARSARRRSDGSVHVDSR